MEFWIIVKWKIKISWTTATTNLWCCSNWFGIKISLVLELVSKARYRKLNSMKRFLLVGRLIISMTVSTLYISEWPMFLDEENTANAAILRATWGGQQLLSSNWHDTIIKPVLPLHFQFQIHKFLHWLKSRRPSGEMLIKYSHSEAPPVFGLLATCCSCVVSKRIFPSRRDVVGVSPESRCIHLFMAARKAAFT